MNFTALHNAINILRPQNDIYTTFIAEFNNIKYLYYKTHLTTNNIIIEQWDCNILYNYEDFINLKNTEKGNRHYFYFKDENNIHLLLRNDDIEHDEKSIFYLELFADRFKFLKNHLFNINMTDLLIEDSEIKTLIQYSSNYMFNIKNELKKNNVFSDDISFDSDDDIYNENEDNIISQHYNTNNVDDKDNNKDNDDGAKYIDEDFMIELALRLGSN